MYPMQVEQGFDLNEHNDLYTMVSHLYKMKISTGKAKHNEMIKFVRTRSFRRSVARREAAQVRS